MTWPRWRTVGETALPGLVAVALALLVVAMRWRGSDLPAHFFRVGLVETDGFKVWNNNWFGGHHTLGYGVLFPVLGAAIGIWTLAVASAGVSAMLADLVIRSGLGRRRLAASLWFAAGTATNVAVGRLPFALGMTVGLAAVLAAQHRRFLVAGIVTVAVAAASPVVSAFLAIVYAGWAIARQGTERRVFAGLAAAAVAPVLVIAAMYPQGGMFPFRFGALVWTLAIAAGVLFTVPHRYQVVRATTGCYMLASVGAFLVPTPLGANITRLGMYAAAPVVLALVPLARAIVVGVLLPAIWFWQWSPSFDAIFRAKDDPSIERAYHRPLLRFLDSVDAETARVEVVPTGRHWETAYVAARFPIARGWERQLDIKFNPLFYEDDLTGDQLHQWLVREGVRYVALADVVLDDSGEQEAALLEEGQPYLRPVWNGDHWRVWEVTDSPGVIDGPAELVSVDTDEITLRVTAPGDVVVRVRASAFWRSEPSVCIEPTDAGWIVLRDVQPGSMTVFLDESNLVGTNDPCDD
jgi:hypothetical protein